MESASGFKKALEAYCNLFFRSCRNAPNCIRNEINLETSIYYTDWGLDYPFANTLQMCYEQGAFGSTNFLMWGLIIGGLLLLVTVVALLIFFL